MIVGIRVINSEAFCGVIVGIRVKALYKVIIRIKREVIVICYSFNIKESLTIFSLL